MIGKRRSYIRVTCKRVWEARSRPYGMSYVGAHADSDPYTSTRLHVYTCARPCALR
jgi:hypothetical protein